MKKIFFYEVTLDILELRYEKKFHQYNIVGEKRDSYIYEDEKHNKMLDFKDPENKESIIWNYTNEDGSNSYYGKLIFDDTDKKVVDKLEKLVKNVDNLYKKNLNSFFNDVHKMEKAFNTIIAFTE